MKAGLALLAERPPQISLKQPFVIDDLPELERYLDHLVAQLAPFAVALCRTSSLLRSLPRLS